MRASIDATLGGPRWSALRQKGGLATAGLNAYKFAVCEPSDEIEVVATFGKEHRTGGSAILPVSANVGMGKVIIAYIFAMKNASYLAYQSLLDRGFDGAKELAVTKHMADYNGGPATFLSDRTHVPLHTIQL